MRFPGGGLGREVDWISEVEKSCGGGGGGARVRGCIYMRNVQA